MKNSQEYTGMEIAIIGIGCRFPGADNWRQFWHNLINGVESIHFYSDEELQALGLSENINKQNYVRAAAPLQDKDQFDAVFFNYSPAEAKLMNPMHRIFHECIWEALEDAGYDPDVTRGMISLYAGAGDDLNWRMYSVLQNRNQEVDDFSLSQLNNKDYLASLISYKLNLKGPAFSINTACSTSLVAVNLACKSLLLGETNIAMAGGVSVGTNKYKGYFYQEGMINSIDGHCRAFDKDASGTVGGEGAGVVVLKRLTDAIKDRDHIYAVIKGSAINNDGKAKVGFTAPAVEGQATCIKKAYKFARVDPATVSYVEAHGTGTRLGDPIELEALNMAFENCVRKSCGIGSVKTNLGHLDTAAGVAGLIKVALSLYNKAIPPSLHFKEANPEITFDNGPFYVNTTLQKWERKNGEVLRAGVSSFGIGGTNAHVVLEEAPEQTECRTQQSYKLLNLSAKNKNSLLRAIDNFKTFLLNNPDINLADASYTLQRGRQHFEWRKAILYQDRDELIQLLAKEGESQTLIKQSHKNRSVVFMFSGAGSQYTNMGRDLYENGGIFREEMDKGFAILNHTTGFNYGEIFYPESANEARINQMLHSQPAIFLFGYSLARYVMSFGIIPQFMIGHSIGEYIAACISGVISYEEALHLIIKRGQLMDRMPPGSMLSAFLSEEEAVEYCTSTVSLAAVNGTKQVVFSGDTASINDLQKLLESRDITCIKLYASHAGHSYTINEIISDYRHELEHVSFRPPSIPFASNLTGKMITNEDASSVDYWLRHMKETVRFSDGLNTLCGQSSDQLLFLEIGGGHTLTNLVKQLPASGTKITGLNFIRHPKETANDIKYFTDRIGVLWEMGVGINWQSFYGQEQRRRVSLPTYSFEHNRYPAEVNPQSMVAGIAETDKESDERNVNNWFYRIQWKQGMWLPDKFLSYEEQHILLFSDNYGLGELVSDGLKKQGVNHYVVRYGERYTCCETQKEYIVNPANENDLIQLFTDLKTKGFFTSTLYHLWDFDKKSFENAHDKASVDHQLNIGYNSLLSIVRAFSTCFDAAQLQLTVVANGWYRITGDEFILPVKAASLGAIKVISKEFPNISCRAIDIDNNTEVVVSTLLKELRYGSADIETALRGNNKYVKDFEKVDFAIPDATVVFKMNGTYVITGANGGMGAYFSGFLANEMKANLILIGRNTGNTEYISALEKKGARVIYIQSDISDKHRVEEGIKIAEEQFGAINGVIHTAGIIDVGGVILRRGREDDKKVFSSKIYGTSVLMSIFNDKQLDFFINCSSISATSAPFGEVAYVAANLFKDACAEAGNTNFPIISIQWSTVKEIGAAVKAVSHLNKEEQEHRLKHGIMPGEMMKVLAGALHLKIPVQVISTKNLKSLLDKPNDEIETERSLSENEHVKERPDLLNEYKTPETETESKLVEMVRYFLGIDRIGTEDNLFELGLDSLKAMVLAKRINKECGVILTIKDFFLYPRIKQMAAEIDERIWIAKGSEKKFVSII